MKHLTLVDWCMLACACAALVCIFEAVALQLGVAQEIVRTGALASADVAGLFWAATGFKRR
jgi:hypothetical protein